jgi:hypothetical protein
MPFYTKIAKKSATKVDRYAFFTDLDDFFTAKRVKIYDYQQFRRRKTKPEAKRRA